MTAEQQKNQGFAQDQIYEIEEGKKTGIDVSVYAKTEFLAIQMRQIRLGLEEGLDVKRYASTDYDWFQMEEIRKGLLAGIDVDKYASKDISYDRMHQIRKGLCDGIDLSTFKKLDAGILKEVRLALQNRISLVPYINKGYDAEQLEAIRKALEKGLLIDPYLRLEYRGISIQEISEGLEHGLDVSIYARIDFCWQQMREIRLGLEHMIDVAEYCDPYFSWQQMREIRLGLEEGLDVSFYRNYIYPAEEMRERRLILHNPGADFHVNKEVFVENPDKDQNLCRVTVSADGMEAYLEVDIGVRNLTRTDVLKALNRCGILYGIQHDVIDDTLNKKKFHNKILVAKGKAAQSGEDGWYEFFFRTEVVRAPKESLYGSVDYRTIEWFETVTEGQKLAYYHKATSGENGISVTGETICAKKGREQNILTGTGFKRLTDGRTYIAALQGVVTLHDFHLEVSNLLIMDEVNLTTGDVHFDGNVCIRHNVSSGAKVRATGDIMVCGYVESAEIVCKGNIVLQQGMNASGSGLLAAGKDILGQFFENTEIYADGNIQGNYFLNCNIHAKEFVVVTGKKGVLAGGRTIAQKGLKTCNLGNPVGIATYVKMGFGEQIAEKEKGIDEAIRNVNQELKALNYALTDFQNKYLPEIRNSMAVYLKIESAIYTKEKELEKLSCDKQKLQTEKQGMEQVCAVVDYEVYEGVTLEIDGLRWISKRFRSVVIKKKDNRIAVFSK